MKKSPVVLFASVLMLASCSHSIDKAAREQLPGDWQVDMKGDGKATFTFAKDGGYKNHVVFKDNQEMDLVGTYYVQDGFLVVTVTNLQTPMIVRSKIIEVDEHEMIVLKDAKQRVFQKDTK